MEDFAQSREPDDLFADDFEPLDEPVYEPEPQRIPTGPAVGTTSTYHYHNGRSQRGGRAGRGNHVDHSPGTSASRFPQVAPSVVSSTTRLDDTESSLPKVPELSRLTPPITATVAADAAVPTKAADVSANQLQTQRITSVRGDRSATGPPKPNKRTEAELTELMSSMRLKASATAASFEKAEQDEASFLQREREVAAKRLEERKAIREQDMERAKNAERKIRARQGREWDSEKVEEEQTAGSQFFRGANGAVGRGAAGLGESRYAVAEQGEQRTYDRGYPRGPARARGAQGHRGRGRSGHSNVNPQRSSQNTTKDAPPNAADFPELPKSTKLVSVKAATPKKSEMPRPGLGASTWAEEMATPSNEAITS